MRAQARGSGPETSIRVVQMAKPSGFLTPARGASAARGRPKNGQAKPCGVPGARGGVGAILAAR